jgi:hypothetical protein
MERPNQCRSSRRSAKRRCRRTIPGETISSGSPCLRNLVSRELPGMIARRMGENVTVFSAPGREKIDTAIHRDFCASQREEWIGRISAAHREEALRDGVEENQSRDAFARDHRVPRKFSKPRAAWNDCPAAGRGSSRPALMGKPRSPSAWGGFLSCAIVRGYEPWPLRSITTTGALNPAPGLPFAAGTNPIYATVDPCGSFLYIVNANSGSVFSI